MHQDSREGDVPTIDAVPKPDVGELSGRPPTDTQGPLRKAPRYYAGKTYKRRQLARPATERNANGSLAGLRDKGARRVIRAAFGRTISSVERGLRLAREMKAQARDIVRDEHKGSRKAQAHQY